MKTLSTPALRRHPNGPRHLRRDRRAATDGARDARAERRGRTDIATFAATAGLLIVVACTASSLPARRAMRIDLMEALRVE